MRKTLAYFGMSTYDYKLELRLNFREKNPLLLEQGCNKCAADAFLFGVIIGFIKFE